MKKATLFFIVLAALFLGLTACGTAPAAAREDAPTITIVNNTGYNVWWVFVSPSVEPTWKAEHEHLGDYDVLIDGGSITITLSYLLSQIDTYDIMLVDEEEDTYTKWEVQIADNDVIVFTIADLDLDF